MRVAQARLQAARERLIGQQRIEMHRRLRHADTLLTGRDRGMEIGERGWVIEPGGFGNEALDELEDAVGAIEEAAQQFMRIDARLCTAFIEPGFDARGVFRRRQPNECEVIATLEMDTGLLEGILPFQVDQRRDGIRKRAVRIELRRKSGRLDEDRPAGAETAQNIVESGGRADELGRRCAVEVRPPESRGPLKRAVLVENNAGRDQSRPRQIVGKAGGTVAIFG